ncbi:MAG: outer membrane protein transport protein [Pseudomonadota bacterium]|nr:outer membrane protein transport protein [Pseudomonadota bacterium]
MTEQSLTGLGTGLGGAAGLAGDDASAVFYNPAAMTLRPGSQLQAGLTYIEVKAEFRGASSCAAAGACAPGPHADGGSGSLVPHGYAATALAERLWLGVGVNVPFGLQSDYGRRWVGRYHAVESRLQTIDLNPVAAWRLSDWLAAGAGFSVQYADATLSQAVFTGTPADGFAEVSGDDIAYGFNAGLMVQPGDTTRLGVSYRSAIDYTLAGDFTVSGLPGPLAARNGTVPAEAGLTLPETVFLSGWQRITQRWAVAAAARWTRWSRFDALRVVNAASGSVLALTPQDWNDSWGVTLGVHYAYSPAWTFRAGLAYDQTPIPDAARRTPRIPDGDRRWLAVGASYRPGDNLTVDLGYTHLFIDNNDIDNTIPLAPGLADRLTGRVDIDSDAAGVQVNWRF